jgi:hypothetical protein
VNLVLGGVNSECRITAETKIQQLVWKWQVFLNHFAIETRDARILVKP